MEIKELAPKNSLARFIITKSNMKFFVVLDAPTKKGAHYPYRGRVFLIKDSHFIPILPREYKSSTIYGILIEAAISSYEKTITTKCLL